MAPHPHTPTPPQPPTVLQPHSPPRPHTPTPPHPHSPPQSYSPIVPHGPTPPHPHSPTAPQPHNRTAPQPHSPTTAQPHNGTPPHPHSPTLPHTLLPQVSLTPLDLAAGSGHLPVVKWIVRQLAAAFPSDLSGCLARAKHQATVEGHKDTAQWLEGCAHWDLLQFAADDGDYAQVRQLLKTGHDPVSQRAPKGHSSLDLALRRQSECAAEQAPRPFSGAMAETVRLLRAASVWSPASHGSFPPHFRGLVRLVLLINGRADRSAGDGLAALPEELVVWVLGYVHRDAVAPRPPGPRKALKGLLRRANVTLRGLGHTA